MLKVANRPFYAALGVNLAGERDIPGLGPVPAGRVRSGPVSEIDA
jgi:hypothetical protein